jgi:4-amino-4-deoxy-L-arabinose transferase-like glycosyltransferase
MQQFKLTKNPGLLFLPFLIFCIILVLVYPTNGSFGDESRYLIYARYMTDGFLPPTELNFDHLGDGPGYSILLIPFIAFHIPIIWIAILNAVLFYFSIVLVFKTLEKFVSFRTTLITSFFLAIYINAYENIILINTETFTLFLISAMMFCIVNAFNKLDFKKYIYFSGLLIGYIAITKVIFGYVLLCMLITTAILWLFNRALASYRKAAVILLIALVTTIPYLIHTYQVTNKIFYWSTFGGNNLYWMSNPDVQEYGSWFPDPGNEIDSNTKTAHLDNFEEKIRLKHQKDFEEINKYTSSVERDDASKRIATNNIKSKPIKFLKNCISNTGRILFNFPYSYKLQTPETLLRLPFTGIIVVLMLFCIIPTFKNWKKIDFSIRFMLLFALTYFGGSILGSAETRMFTVIVPILLCWLAFICERAFKIKIKFD